MGLWIGLFSSIISTPPQISLLTFAFMTGRGSSKDFLFVNYKNYCYNKINLLVKLIQCRSYYLRMIVINIYKKTVYKSIPLPNNNSRNIAKMYYVQCLYANNISMFMISYIYSSGLRFMLL